VDEKALKRVLVVDDNPENIHILVNNLQTRYEVICTTSGKEALEIAFSDDQPDIILLDIMMPDMDGFEVCSRLKANAETWSIPVIFITALGQEVDETRGLNLGAVDFITKPFSIPVAKARIEAQLRLKEEMDHRITLARKLEALNKNLEARIQKKAAALEQAHEDLKTSEYKYRSIYENAIEGIFQATPEGRFLSVNPALARMHSYDSPEDLIAHVTDIGRQHYVNPEERTRFQECLEEHGSVRGFETEEYRKDGSRIWVSINAHSVRGSDGGIRYYEGTVEDVSEHRRLAKALRDSEARYRHITETLTDYIYTVRVENGKSVETRHGAGCLTVTGYTEEEFAADPHLWFRMVAEEDRTAVVDLAGRVMAGEKASAIEHRLVRKDGVERWVRNTPVVRRDTLGTLVSYDGLIQDITERKRAEEEIHRLNQELEQRVKNRTARLEAANRELDAFAYSVSHDLRTPLRHIDGYLELLQKKAEAVLDEQSRHYMDTISDAGKKMGLLIDDLLSFSRMGRHALSFRPVELGILVRDVIRELEPDAAGRNIEWRIGDLPAVCGDAAMLRMVLSNLISNALKFTRPRQQAQIEIGSLPGQGSEAVIFVRDNGAGFDMTYVDRLFGVFQRLHRADEFEGTGIGLANVRRIINRHGGRTWAEGKVDQGATFYFSLPQTQQGGGYANH
jgi:PAS domain S-box-containing protein